MSSQRRSATTVVAAAAALVFVGGFASVAEASLARTLGSKFGTKLSSNQSTRTQQVTADPPTVEAGSNTLEYDASKVTFDDFIEGPEFDVTYGIGIRYADNPPVFVDRGTFLDDVVFGGIATEVGLIKADFSRVPSSFVESIIDPASGFVEINRSSEYEQGDDTHAVFFTLRSGFEIDTEVSYRLFADPTTNDFVEQIGNPTPITDVIEATVSGPFVVPEPASGALMLGVFGFAALSRKRRVCRY